MYFDNLLRMKEMGVKYDDAGHEYHVKGMRRTVNQQKTGVICCFQH